MGPEWMRGNGWFRYHNVQSDPGEVAGVERLEKIGLDVVSRAQSPTEARPWLGDRRRLGVRVKRIVLRGAGEAREVPVDHPDLTRGWWAVERDGQMISRWTDGEAVLPLPAMRGTRNELYPTLPGAERTVSSVTRC
jgi:hypothetical protein